MHIDITPILTQLEFIGNNVGNLEFSGLAFARKIGGAMPHFLVYDFVVLDVGSSSLTDIPAEKLLPLMKRDDHSNMRVWFHRHPVGNGITGAHNWSKTDTDTIELIPLGGIPELVRWSISIVRTPRGWVGRIDDHIKKITHHVEVFPKFDDLTVAVDAIRLAQVQERAARLVGAAIPSFPHLFESDWDDLSPAENELLELYFEADENSFEYGYVNLTMDCPICMEGKIKSHPIEGVLTCGLCREVFLES